MGYRGAAVGDYGSMEAALASDVVHGKLLLMLERAGAYYCAVDRGNGRVGAAVVIEQTEGTERLFIEIPEEMVPPVCLCPLEILRLLTPTGNVTAKAWRERCWAWNIEVVHAAIHGPLAIAERLNAEAFPAA